MSQATTSEVDVAVIGGGIVGLSVALQLLSHASKLSVALVERQVPCSGATGAGVPSTCTGQLHLHALSLQHKHSPTNSARRQGGLSIAL